MSGLQQRNRESHDRLIAHFFSIHYLLTHAHARIEYHHRHMPLRQLLKEEAVVQEARLAVQEQHQHLTRTIIATIIINTMHSHSNIAMQLISNHISSSLVFPCILFRSHSLGLSVSSSSSTSSNRRRNRDRDSSNNSSTMILYCLMYSRYSILWLEMLCSSLEKYLVRHSKQPHDSRHHHSRLVMPTALECLHLRHHQHSRKLPRHSSESQRPLLALRKRSSLYSVCARSDSRFWPSRSTKMSVPFATRYFLKMTQS